MTWFEELTGSTESSPEDVRRDLSLDGPRLRSRRNGGSWHCGELETPTLGQLRQRVLNLKRRPRPASVRSIIADARQLHADTSNANALFQVASQFNLLEMVGPHVTPERGVGIYESDPTQGPACAISAGAGTIFRNYFAPVNGRMGQTADNQIDCLAGLGTLLGNDSERLWQMQNGYALPSAAGLDEVDGTLQAMPETERDQLREALQIGLHWDTEVTLPVASHRVSQAYCSALPVVCAGTLPAASISSLLVANAQAPTSSSSLTARLRPLQRRVRIS